METEQPLMLMDTAATGHCRQYGLHALCLPGIVGCLNSASGSIVADDIKVPKGPTLNCNGDTASNLYVVKSGGYRVRTTLCGNDAHISGFRIPGNLVGACGLTGSLCAFTVQALGRSTVCQALFERLRKAQFKQPALAQGLLQAIAHQTTQAQHQITRTNLLAPARFGFLIQNINTHHKKRKLFNTEFELPMSQTDTANILALASKTSNRLISSLTEKKILIFENKAVRILHQHALEHACEALN